MNRRVTFACEVKVESRSRSESESEEGEASFLRENAEYVDVDPKPCDLPLSRVKVR
jgi:hypothetical protein